MPEPITREAPPLPGRPLASQRWSDLVFLHWRVESARVAPLLPPGVRPDEFDGSTWVGLVPFRLSRATLLGSPPVPYVGTFVEVNVRLYGVDGRGRRGVVFRSLEASRLLAVLTARAAFALPYEWSRTSVVAGDGMLRYRSERHGGGARFAAVARPGAAIEPGPLEDFLTARWGMFTVRRARTRFTPNTHIVWPLHTAELVEFDDELVAAGGLPGVTSRAPDSVLFSPGVDTWFGRPARA